MLNAVLFIADPNMAGLLRRLAGESNEFAFGSVVELTRTGYSINRTLSTTKPDVMLLEMTDLNRDLPQAAALHTQSPDVPIVGFRYRASSSCYSNALPVPI